MSLSPFLDLLDSTHPHPVVSPEQVSKWSQQFSVLTGLEVYPRSLAMSHLGVFFMAKKGHDKYLAIFSEARIPGFEGDSRTLNIHGRMLCLQICPTIPENALSLRRTLLFTAPRVWGLRRSAGLGDRLGLATPGHVRALREHHFAPIFAQQSVREMQRLGRTPEDVLEAACWGVFQEGWQQGFGADADHLKTQDDVDRSVTAEFTFYTIDSSDHVDDNADHDPATRLEAKIQSLPWDVLEASPADLEGLYLGKRFFLDGYVLEIDKASLVRAAVKYGRAVAHTANLYRHLASRMGTTPFELEISLDETDSPTTVLEHFFVAGELKRLGVEWISLAPRFMGRFEKAVDYIGDLDAFEESVARHAAVARVMGPYKLSLHSGSDKFSIYPIVARHAGEHVHLKTAGTSYLEALRIVAGSDPGLFRRIMAFALECYQGDRESYHVSADPSRVTAPAELKDTELSSVLDQHDGRQILHVTFGSVLTARNMDGTTRFRDRLFESLHSNEEAYYEALRAHLERHLALFEG